MFIKIIMWAWFISSVYLLGHEIFGELPQVEFSYSSKTPTYIEYPDGTRKKVGVNTELPAKYEKVWVM